MIPPLKHSNSNHLDLPKKHKMSSKEGRGDKDNKYGKPFEMKVSGKNTCVGKSYLE